MRKAIIKIIIFIISLIFLFKGLESQEDLEDLKIKEELDSNSQFNLNRTIKHFNLYSSSKINKELEEKNKLIIPIAFALDHGYVNPTIVAMTSICVNAYKTTFYEMFILVPEGFNKNDSEKILTVKEKNLDKCNVTIINMGLAYSSAKLGNRIPAPSYYRLSLPSLFKQYSKMLYLDGDIIALTDLSEMYNSNIVGKYALGNIAYKQTDFKRFNIPYDELYICGGVLLLNLKKMREDDFETKANNLIREHKDKLEWHDQTVLNVIGVGKVGLLPAKFGIINHLTYEDIFFRYRFASQVRIKNHYKEKEMIEAFHKPSLIHFNDIPKPWKVGCDSGFSYFFWYYAKQSSVYDELWNNYVKEEEKKAERKREDEKRQNEINKRKKEEEEKLKKEEKGK